MESNEGQGLPAQSEISEALLSLLACPACHERVERQEGMLRCRGCGLGFPVRDGVPVMLLEEALPPVDGPCGHPEAT